VPDESWGLEFDKVREGQGSVIELLRVTYRSGGRPMLNTVSRGHPFEASQNVGLGDRRTSA
jgi:hypothetical protein